MKSAPRITAILVLMLLILTACQRAGDNDNNGSSPVSSSGGPDATSVAESSREVEEEEKPAVWDVIIGQPIQIDYYLDGVKYEIPADSPYFEQVLSCLINRMDDLGYLWYYQQEGEMEQYLQENDYLELLYDGVYRVKLHDPGDGVEYELESLVFPLTGDQTSNIMLMPSHILYGPLEKPDQLIAVLNDIL